MGGLGLYPRGGPLPCLSTSVKGPEMSPSKRQELSVIRGLEDTEKDTLLEVSLCG